ncbi:MAG: FmdB family zinc ribbon protein [Nitrospirota bacterium]
MPEYDYICEKCQEEFVEFLSLKEYETKRPICPKCGSDQVKRVFKKFFAKTDRKS